MKNISLIVVFFFIGLFVYYFFDRSDTTFTLYRNSALLNGENMRIHIATFDASEKSFWGERNDGYNKGNCDLAASLFQQQPGVKTKFWCEKGAFRK